MRMSRSSLCATFSVPSVSTSEIRGDHHIFGREGTAEILNLQPLASGKAKPYQVKQVRNVIVRYKLVEEPDAN